MELDDGIDHPDREGGPSEFRPRPFPADDDLTHSAFVADQTLEFLDTHQDDRFLCVTGFFAPHQPYVVPQRFLDQYDPSELSPPAFPDHVEDREGTHFSDEAIREATHGYYALVSEVDHYVGEILQYLDDLGLRENTIVVFTSDHGEYLGEHLQYGKGFPGEDCVSRVPLIVRWPDGVDSPGRTVSEIVEAVDLIPTLLECAGIQVPPHLRGRSFLGALREGTFSGRESALLAGGARRLEGHSLRTDRFRYVLQTTGEEALYDLDKELGEYTDVSEDSEYESDLSRLRYQLLRRLQEIETPRPRSWVY
jgi:arylsulfatase A-like enzyme